MITVVAPGWATTVQDLGRPGYAHLGVSPSGMVDPALGTLVNRLVGNPDGAALIETCGGLVVRADRPVLVATSVEAAPFTVAAGDTYRLPAGERLWHYVAVRGGLAVEPVLGSAATDTMAGLGPAPLAAGEWLPIGDDPGTEVTLDVAPLGPLADVARFTVGARADWFAPGWTERLREAVLTVDDVSRVGVRLSGVVLERARHAELPSEGLVRGAVQAPPGGELVMMLADHPTTGGYPVVAVVHPDDVAIIAQHRPGTTVRLRPA
ncbi:MAG TPA: biotin-dependent carboxyltransferase family protein [Ilumatobacter sp.]|nr:biotin-dependent carboxyltransferase family protein [Ilumatobacter sp.]